jgi:deoxyribodipyrimidine photo-lyase
MSLEAQNYMKAHSSIPSSVSGFDLSKDHAEALKTMYPVGQKVALKILAEFIAKKAQKYQPDRDFPAIQGTSMLSPYLSAGVLSPRECFKSAMKANGDRLDSGNPGLVTWISELCWRDFYKNILVAFPRVCKNKPFKMDTDQLEWLYNDEQFQLWCQGKTGFPIVDAGMRQLNATGWMHNRVRMVTAMFLSKDLLLDWRLGEKYFMQNLIDGDFASNNGGWQWVIKVEINDIGCFHRD